MELFLFMQESYTQKYIRILLMVVAVVVFCIGGYNIYNHQLSHAIEMSRKNLELVTVQSHLDVMNAKLSLYTDDQVSDDNVFSPSLVGDKLAQLENRLVSLEQNLASARADASLISVYDERDTLVSDIKFLFADPDVDALWVDLTDNVGTWSFMSNYNSSSKMIPSLWLCTVSGGQETIVAYATADYNVDTGLFENFKANSLYRDSLAGVFSEDGAFR